MKYSIFIALSLLLGACASQPSSSTAFAPGPSGTAVVEQAAIAAERSDAAAPAEAPDSLALVRTVDVEEIDNGRVCEQRKRPGSNITQKFCYTRQERIALQAAREEAREGQLDELRREQHWRDEIMRQAEMNQQRPSGFGFGPD